MQNYVKDYNAERRITMWMASKNTLQNKKTMDVLPNKALFPLQLGVTETGTLSNRKILVEVSVTNEFEEMRAINFTNDKMPAASQNASKVRAAGLTGEGGCEGGWAGAR
jgi:hypothetical protein